MKKIFLCVLLTLVLVCNTVILATPETTEPTDDLTPEVTQSPEVTATPTSPADEPDDIITPSPTTPPSQTPPFTFKVTTLDGSNEIVQGENDDLKLKFEITPNGTENFTIISIENGDTNFSFGKNDEVSKNSGTVLYVESVYFNHTSSDKNVDFTLVWSDFSGKTRYTKATVTIKVATPIVSVSASVDGAILPGVPFTVKYFVKNEGNVPVTNILVQDVTAAFHDNSVSFPVINSLGAGESFECSASIAIDGEIKLTPSVSYKYNNKEYSFNGTELSIIAIDVIPTLELSCDSYDVEYVGALHKFNFTITNTAAVAITNVTIYDGDDESAGIVEENIEIEAGGIYIGEYYSLVDKSDYYKFKITYTYQGADGEKEQTARTEKPLKLPNDIVFSVEKANPPTLDDSGKMTFTILVENGAMVELRDVILSEKSGLIDSIELPNIPAAKGSNVARLTKDVEVLIPVEATLIDFTLSYTLDGKTVTKDASYDIIFTGTPAGTVTEAPPTIVPVTPDPNANINNKADDDSDGFDFKTFLIIFLLILLIILIIVFIIFIIVKSKKESKVAPVAVRRRTVDAFDDFDYDDEYDDEYDEEYDEEYDDYEDDDTPVIGVAPDVTGDTTVIPRVPVDTPKEETPDESDVDTDGEMNSVTSAIFGTHNINDDKEFSTDFNDEVDDEGVKIFKGKK